MARMRWIAPVFAFVLGLTACATENGRYEDTGQSSEKGSPTEQGDGALYGNGTVVD